MAGFLRRFQYFPPLDVITEIEAVNIIDLVPAGIFVGRASGTVCLVGEWPAGPFNEPLVCEGNETIVGTLGGFSLSLTNPFSFAAGPPVVWTNPYSNGNAFAWLKGKSYRRLILVRVDNTLAEGVNIQITGTPTPLAADLLIPAGTRVYDASGVTREYALAQNVVFAAGTALGTVAFTAFDETDLTAKYTTRTVSGVPVYSTDNVAEGAVGNVDTANAQDLFRAGIGAGTALPSIVVTPSTGALDGCPANSLALAPINSAAYDTRYEAAIDATLPGNPNVDNVEIIASARESAAIRLALQDNAGAASQVGTGRVATIRPPIGTNAATAIQAGAPGVGATRSDRVIYSYPHIVQRISELAELDPEEAISSPNILIGGDACMSTILSQLAPELNPGQSTQQYQAGGILSFIRSLEPGLTTSGQPTVWTISNYISFRSAGVAAIRRDPQISEWVFQSGITSVDGSLYPSLVNINRRRMADFIQDSLATIAKKYNKHLRTTDRVDTMVGEMDDFLSSILAEATPSQQRIAAYSIDATSGNTVTLQGSGIFVVIVQVQLLDTMDFIVIQTEIGQTVQVSVLEAA